MRKRFRQGDHPFTSFRIILNGSLLSKVEELLTLSSFERNDQRTLTGHYISTSELPTIRPEHLI